MSPERVSKLHFPPLFKRGAHDPGALGARGEERREGILQVRGEPVQDDVRDDWLLLLESEQAPPGYDDTIFSSGGAPNGEWLGWVLPNVDTDGDGVIDAWELLLGTDPQVADSDDDNCSDGDEILGYAHSYLAELSDPLDGVCVLQLRIFADGFESGDVSSWSWSAP